MKKTKKVAFVVGIVVIGGVSGIISSHYLFPRLAMTKFFSKYEFIKKATDDVTIINKTEQVYIKDDTSVSKIASQVVSSVVNIVSYASVEKNASQSKNINTQQPITKSGTGLIVASDGLIVTYNSVLLTENAKYKIETSDGNVYDATLWDVDSYSNLAFLKITANNLPTVSFANSNDSKPGEKIIAIGNDAVAHTAFFASGILSAFNPYHNLSDKALASSEKLEGVFEIDLPVQNHYVGGPVIDYSSQVIGITGMVKKDNQDVFFQIPSNTVKLVIDKALRRELSTNSTLGIYYLPLTKTLASVYNISTESGVLIHSPSGQQGLAIIANSPAFNAGLKINDVIKTVAGEIIDEEHALPNLLYKHKKGEEIELMVLRGDEELKIKVQL